MRVSDLTGENYYPTSTAQELLCADHQTVNEMYHAMFPNKGRDSDENLWVSSTELIALHVMKKLTKLVPRDTRLSDYAPAIYRECALFVSVLHGAHAGPAPGRYLRVTPRRGVHWDEDDLSVSLPLAVLEVRAFHDGLGSPWRSTRTKCAVEGQKKFLQSMRIQKQMTDKLYEDPGVCRFLETGAV